MQQMAKSNSTMYLTDRVSNEKSHRTMLIIVGEFNIVHAL